MAIAEYVKLYDSRKSTLTRPSKVYTSLQAFTQPFSMSEICSNKIVEDYNSRLIASNDIKRPSWPRSQLYSHNLVPDPIPKQLSYKQRRHHHVPYLLGMSPRSLNQTSLYSRGSILLPFYQQSTSQSALRYSEEVWGKIVLRPIFSI